MQYGQALKAATAPYQVVLQTRTGTEALAHLLNYLTDAWEDTVVVSLDGMGTFFWTTSSGQPSLREWL